MASVILRHSVKSLQLVVNETMNQLNQPPMTASAYSQARYKLKHSAFIELNQTSVVDVLYGDGAYQTFWGFRVLAIDGSKLVLPDQPAVREAFGTIAWTNGKTDQIQGERPYGLVSVLYDVLNRIALEATLAPAKAYEIDLAVAQLTQTRHDDLLLMDRNYPSYRMLAELTRQKRHFVIRCSAASFAQARRMLKGEGPNSQQVTLKPCAEQHAKMRKQQLPQALKVRFVRVRLSNGEYEVLVTSLLDERHYPSADFLALYGLRWGIENFYGVLKTRLALENFTGIGVEAIRQDFHATVYLTGLETLLTTDAQTQLDAKITRHPQTVNRAVSFNAIKTQALDLLLGEPQQTETVLDKLTALFLTNPCLDRPQRNPPRNKTPTRALLSFHKRQKKQCF